MLRKNSRGDATVHVRCSNQGNVHWIVLKWVDYHRFQTTCDSSQRDSLICKNFIYAWPALITKGVCALNSPQRDARNVCQDWRVKTSRPLARPSKRLRDTQPFHALQRRLASTWDLGLIGSSLLFQNGGTEIKHSPFNSPLVILHSGWQECWSQLHSTPDEPALPQQFKTLLLIEKQIRKNQIFRIIKQKKTT